MTFSNNNRPQADLPTTAQSKDTGVLTADQPSILPIVDALATTSSKDSQLDPTPDNAKQSPIQAKADRSAQLGQVPAGKKSVSRQQDDRGWFSPANKPDRPLRPHRFGTRSELLKKSPRVLVSPDAYKRMQLYVEIADKEVGWYGTVTRLSSGDFYIDTTFLLEQEVTAVETELSVEGLDKLVCQLLERGDAGIEQINRLRFWGHSHVRMEPQASGTDESTMVRFGNDGLPWYIRGIFNKLGKAIFTIYLYDEGYRIIDAPWAVWHPKAGLILEGSHANMVTQVNVPGATTAGKASALNAPDERAQGVVLAVLAAGKSLIGKPALPPSLVPSQALRVEVTAEFQAKVKERPSMFQWFGGSDSRQADRASGSFDGGWRKPAGFERAEQEPGSKHTAPASPAPDTNNRSAAPGSNRKPEKGFLEQFFEDLFNPS